MAAFLMLLRFHCPFLRFLLNFDSAWVYNLYKNKPFIFGERLICCNSPLSEKAQIIYLLGGHGHDD